MERSMADSTALREAIRDLAERARPGLPGPLRLEPVARPPGKVLADSSLPFIVRSGPGAMAAFALASPAAAPAAVAEGVAQAVRMRRALGDELGQHVLVPLAASEHEGRAIAVYPVCRALAESRWAWRAQRAPVIHWALGWLRGVARATAHAPAPGAELELGFLRPLEALAGAAELDGEVRSAARAAAGRVEGGAWKPVHVAMHGDFWKGNVLVRRRPRTLLGLVPAPRDLVVIDWATSLADGYALFDLVRMADSVNLSRRALRREVLAHCRILGCAPDDARGHVLAALGRRLLGLGRFPVDRFAHMARTVLALVQGAVP